jgi:alpha-glucosidase
VTRLLPAALLLFAIASGTRARVADGPILVRSPDGKVGVTVTVGETLTYAISFEGRPVVLPSAIELALDDPRSNAPPLGRELRVVKQTRRTIDQTWTAVHGKRRQVRDHANELELELRETAAPWRRLDLVARAYDEGAAFRYALPVQPGLQTFLLHAERTQFRFAGDHTAWAANYRSFVGAQEAEFRRTSIDQLAPTAVIGLPLLVRVDDARARAAPVWLAITESDLLDWAGMYLRGATAAPHTLETTLSPRPDHPELVVMGVEQRLSPWRVFLVGDRPGALVEADLVRNLATPSQIADTSWIKPGRAAWDRWWSGDYDPDAKAKLGMNTATMKSFVALAGEMGWEYQIVDWTWYGDPERPDADLTHVVPDLDLPALVTFASDRKVGLWLWARWNQMDKQMARALPLYERWGVKGVKVDFMNRDDQEMVGFYWRLAKTAAEHHLMVDLHGAYKPTGLERTWPNLLTREGVMGNEYNKWSSRVTPTHKTTLPFTRMLAGPMDFTPGGFRHATLEGFVAKDHAPAVMGTRAAELALTIVYESGLLVLCDSPYEYRHARGQGVELLREVPAAWDETRVIDGAPGELVIVARRAGDRWYLAGLTSEVERTARVPLGFLSGDTGWHLRLWSDAPDGYQHPEKVVESDRAVRSQDTLAIPMAPGGGFAAVLVANGAPQGAKVTHADFHGWEALVIRNQTAEVVVVPAIGRIMRFGLIDGSGVDASPFWVHPAAGAGLAADPNGWINYGGDKAWPAPQADWPKVTGRGWPPPAAFDSAPHEARVDGNRIELVSEVDPGFGTRVRRTIALDDARPVLSVETTYEKVQGPPVSTAVWTITQLAAPERLAVLLPARATPAAGYTSVMPAPPLHARRDGRLLSLERDPTSKTMIRSDGRTLLWVGSGPDLLVESPDADAHSQIYTSSDDSLPYVELELMGRLRELSVGQRLSMKSRYTLIRRKEADPQREAAKVLRRARPGGARSP